MLKKITMTISLIAAMTHHCFASQPSSYYALIANPQFVVTQTPSKGQIASLFLKKSILMSRNNIKAIALNNSNQHAYAAFYAHFADLSVDEIKQYWQQQIFSGGNQPPKAAANKQLMQSIAKHRDIISYIAVKNLLHSKLYQQKKISVIMIWKTE